jgi:hypothetical protein
VTILTVGNYEEWTMEQLKEELRRRHMAVPTKRTLRIKRLRAFDKTNTNPKFMVLPR